MRRSHIFDCTEVVARTGVVTAAHPLVAEAGMAIRQQGGRI